MERTMGYALGYYDAVITAMKEEDIPLSMNRVVELLDKTCDESSMFEEVVHKIGIEVLARHILTGDDYEEGTS